MKKIILLLFVVSFGFKSIAQIPYYDAIELKKNGVVWNESKKVYDLPENPGAFKVLKYYVSTADSNNQNKIEASFNHNPFITFLSQSESGPNFLKQGSTYLLPLSAASMLPTLPTPWPDFW